MKAPRVTCHPLILLILVFSVLLGWLPSFGRGEVLPFLLTSEKQRRAGEEELVEHTLGHELADELGSALTEDAAPRLGAQHRQRRRKRESISVDLRQSHSGGEPPGKPSAPGWGG